MKRRGRRKSRRDQRWTSNDKRKECGGGVGGEQVREEVVTTGTGREREREVRGGGAERV